MGLYGSDYKKINFEANRDHEYNHIQQQYDISIKSFWKTLDDPSQRQTSSPNWHGLVQYSTTLL